MATGASWLCYFKALQTGDINKVVPIDKSSTILTVLLALIFFNESVTVVKAVAVVIMAVGTFLMIEKKDVKQNESEFKRSWLIFAVLSAVFASLSSLLAKAGMNNAESNLGTAIRTAVVLVMAWMVVFVTKKQGEIKKIEKKELAFILLSGLATGASWLCYFKALKDGQASVVVPIDKLSILVSILFSYIVFKEKLTKKSLLGLILIVVGTLMMII